MDTIQRDTVSCGGMTFDLLTAGPSQGEPVVLLHGFPEFSEQWTSQLEALADAGYRAIAVDQRGYSPGARPADVAAYTVAHLVSDVVGIADALDLGRFHLVGHDWGGAVAWTVASLHANRLLTLTVFSTPHTAELHKFAQFGDQRERLTYVDLFRTPETAETTFLSDGAAVLRSVYEGKVPADRVELFVARLSQPGALTAAFNWYRALDPGILLIPLAGRVTTPTLYVYSTADMAIGPDAAKASGEWVDAPYRFEILDGTTHWIPEEAADQATSMLLEHIRQPR